MEGVLREVRERELDAVRLQFPDVTGEFRVYPGERRGLDPVLVQSEVQSSVRDHGVRVAPRIPDGGLYEPQRLVEFERREHVGGTDSDLQKPAEHRNQFVAPWASARRRDSAPAAASSNVPSSGQPCACFSTRCSYSATCASAALRHGT